jgi:maltose O-acetyltransferase
MRNVHFGGKPCIQFHDKNGKIIIGNNTWINKRCYFNCKSGIIIGADCMIGQNCAFIDNRSHPVLNKSPESKVIIIGDNVWIAYGCIILKGVHIGCNSVIGAGSVVTKNVPANSFACGNPAIVKKRVGIYRGDFFK